MNLNGFSGKKICVAVSGGVDSVSLLHYMKTQEEPCGYLLSAVHCEHGIRGEESLSDARFVEQLCKTWGIPLHTFFENCPSRAERDKESLETAARKFRRECFVALIEEGKADYIATAHHKNDEAETVLFRLARGTSLSGVGGMSAMNGYLIRPFLEMTRQEIETYAKENGLHFCEDSTNKERCATRNKLRLDVIPLIEDAVPGAVENLTRFATLATEDDRLLYRFAARLLKKEEGRLTVAFSEEKPLFRRACLLALKELGVQRDYTQAQLERAWELQSLHRGAKQTVLQGIVAEKIKDGLEFYKEEEISIGKPEEKPFGLDGFDGGRYEVKVACFPILEKSEWKILRLDGDKLPLGAVFRFRKEGDFIRRFGSGKKSLKKFFNEKKIPIAEREYLPLIAEKDGAEVYAVCGVEISEAVKVTADTKNPLFIEIIKK